MLQSSAEKCCKEWPKISVQNSVGKMVQIWPRKVRTKLLRNSTQKFGRECKNQMRSISAMNSQSSIDWVTVYEIRTCDLFKHQQKLQPLVGMLRRVSMLIGRPQPIWGCLGDRPGPRVALSDFNEVLSHKKFQKCEFWSNISRERSKRAIFYPKIKGDNSSLELCGSTTTNF